MANSLKLSDNLLWRTTDIVMPYKGNYYNFNDIKCEVRAGTVAIPNVVKDWGDRGWVSFDHPMSADPIVIVSNASDHDRYYQCGINFNTAGVPTSTGFYWKRFNMWDDMDYDKQAISYLAVVPKIPASSYTSAQQKSLGRNPLPTALSSNLSLKMSDANYWDLSSIHDIQDTMNYTLDKTFWKIVTGSTTLTVPNDTDGAGKVVNIGYTFKEPPHIILTICDAVSGASTYTHDGMQGLVSVSAFSRSIATGTGSVYSGSVFPTKTWNMYNQFALRGWNSSGASRTIGVNWVAIGLTQ